MRFLFWLIILATLAVLTTLLADLNTGYVLFIVPPYRIDFSLNLFIVSLFFIGCALYVLAKLSVATFSLPQKMRDRRARRQQLAARKQGYAATMAFIAGNMTEVDQLASKALVDENDEEAYITTALIGAKAAHIRHDKIQREDYLQKAEKRGGASSLAVKMLKAEISVDEQDYQHALSLVKQIRHDHPKVVSAISLELRIQRLEKNALRVIALTNKLEKLDVLDTIRAERIRHEAYLQHITKMIDSQELNHWWQKLPSTLKYNTPLVSEAVKTLIQLHDPAAAGQMIEKALSKSWDTALLTFYSELYTTERQLTAQLQQAEIWLEQRPNDAELLRTLGKICMHLSLWGKAHSYFEASLAIAPHAKTYVALAQLFTQLSQFEQAAHYYQQSVEWQLSTQ